MTKWMEGIRLVLQLSLSGITFGIFYCLLQSNIKERAKQSVKSKMVSTKYHMFQYERIDLFLSRYGAHYMFESLEPFFYLFLKISLGFIFLLIGGYLWSFLLTVPLFLLGFFLPDALLVFSNSKDNDSMLEDIKKVYDTMRIQSRAGVFLNDTLTESYLMIKNRRLKAAMLELVNQIAARSNIELAVDTFNIRFKCTYIDTLCIVIKQSLQSGKTVQILTDISSQLNFIRNAIALKEKERLERRIAVLEVLIYIAMLAIGLYVLSFEFNHILEL